MKRNFAFNIFLMLCLLILIPILVYFVNSKTSYDNRSKAAVSDKQIVLLPQNPEDYAQENADANGAVEIGTRELRLGWYKKIAGLRFSSTELRQLKNTMLTDVFLKVMPSYQSGTKVNIDIYAELNNNCSVFQTAGKNLSTRSKTSTKINWNLNSGTWDKESIVRSPDLKDLVNEVLNNPGRKGNNLCLFLVQNGSETYKERTFYAQGPDFQKPKLVIKYSILGSQPIENSSTCSALDAASLGNCFNRINNGSADKIEILQTITCQGTNACLFKLDGINREVSIYGLDSGQIAIKRNDDFNYPLLSITNSKNISLKNIVFEEKQSNCFYESNGNCPQEKSTITVTGSENILFDKIKIRNSRYMGIEVKDTSNFNLTNSEIINSMVFGVWYGRNSGKSVIENNRFINIRSNAILFSGKTTAENPSLISNNIFNHNHRETVFHTCGDASGNAVNGTIACGGGQLYIAGNTDNLKIINNKIFNGSQDTDTWQFSSGIELYFKNISNVLISGNDIHNNTGPGIETWGYPDRTTVNLPNISVVGNRIYSNGYADIAIANGIARSSNCFTANCPIY